MSQHAGRKPMTTAHVDHLYGSTRAKDRLRIFLETLRGTLPVPDACTLLEIGEAQFHHLRRQWLQESLELLEPRRRGRPPIQQDAKQLAAKVEQLESEVASLKEELRGAQTREEVARILGNPGSGPLKKTDDRAGRMTMKPR